ncbi:MAG TPA: haloacid dehalogenase [Chitinophagaceae bacterium]|nr:haloacid dehalogenase [Chitinophagaceae bacterium]
MRNKEIKIIFWDFDGVIMNSNSIRDFGFQYCLTDFPQYQIDELMVYHRLNGGLSRYNKFRYFFEKIRGEEVSDARILDFSQNFSSIMKDKLCDKNLLIKEIINFIKINYKNFTFHITSGSDENELRFICKELDISAYFKSIHGSPTPKNLLVKELIINNNYPKKNCLLIGDSVNDFQAAHDNGIYFKSYNASNDVNALTNYKFEIL